MRYDPDRHHRRSIRLRGYDYTQAGAYFVTICTHNRACLFGDVVDGQMRLNEAGQMVEAVWDDLPAHYTNVVLDAFVIMPNHVHGIIILRDPVVGAGFKPAPMEWAGLKPAPTKPHALPEIIRGFKTFSARAINVLRGTPGVPVWQRNYYEHIIRDEAEFHRIAQYIHTNPANWATDQENPNRRPIYEIKRVR